MRHQRLAATIVAAPGPLAFHPSEQAKLAPKPADNDNVIAVTSSATAAIWEWRSVGAGVVVHRFVPALIIVGAILTLAWSAALAWAVFRIVVWSLG